MPVTASRLRQNYLLPTDTRLNRATFKNQNIALAAIMDAMVGSDRIALVLLDACRKNPFSNWTSNNEFADVSPGLARPDFINGVLIAFATEPGQTARDGQGAEMGCRRTKKPGSPQSGRGVSSVTTGTTLRRRRSHHTPNRSSAPRSPRSRMP